MIKNPNSEEKSGKSIVTVIIFLLFMALAVMIVEGLVL